MLTACATVGDRTERAFAIGNDAGLHPMRLTAGEFDILAFVRTGRPGESVRIYFEGDGAAFDARRQPTKDPTPTDPIGLRLAATDEWPNVAYLARPCQFIGSPNDQCAPQYWTDARYAPEVVAAMNEAVDQLATAARAPAAELVGFSGGGAIAVLVAARRTDVKSIRTVAANLDLQRWTSLHQVRPLFRSLDPAGVSEAVQHIPQRHFFGESDLIVSPSIGHSFVARSTASACIDIVVVPHAGHTHPWPRIWRQLLAVGLNCTSSKPLR
jgi:hypothetical protein